PLHVAGLEIIRGESADEDDAQAVDDDRRRRGVELRDFLGGLTPGELARGRVEAGDDAMDAERADLAIAVGGSAARAGIALGVPLDGGGGVLVLPQLLAGRRIQAQRDLLAVDSPEGVDLVARRDRGRLANADGDLPFLGEVLG